MDTFQLFLPNRIGNPLGNITGNSISKEIRSNAFFFRIKLFCKIFTYDKSDVIFSGFILDFWNFGGAETLGRPNMPTMPHPSVLSTLSRSCNVTLHTLSSEFRNRGRCMLTRLTENGRSVRFSASKPIHAIWIV